MTVAPCMPRTPRILLTLLFVFASAFPCALSSARAEDKPFSVGIEFPVQLPITPAVENSIRELGIDYLNYYIITDPAAPPEFSPEKVNNDVMAMCLRLGLKFSIATHQFDPPDTTVLAAAKQPGFQGMVFDELEHIRMLQAAEFKATPRELWLADPDTLTTYTQADAAITAGFARLGKKFKALGAPAVVSTHVWPVLFHQAARAGLTVCPKICMMEYSPISFANGLGAALEYDRPLWADCDMWYCDLLPGHSAEEIKCNLMLAYWMGAERIYLEGCGFNLHPQGRQGIPFSLMTQIKPDLAQLTAHGEALRWFCREYLPAHPRQWTWRDVRPDIAIIRFEDSDHGQTHIWNPAFLYGTKTLPSTPDTQAWHSIFNMLTRGATGHDGLTYMKAGVWLTQSGRPNQDGFWPSFNTRPVAAGRHHFFSPLGGAVVFDERVGYERLKDIPLLFLTGLEASDKTMAALHKRVAEGATCVAWGPLARKHGFADWPGGVQVRPEGKGKFVITDDFEALAVLQQIGGLLGDPDTISYRFGNQRVSLRRGATPDAVTVEVTPTP